MTRAELIQLKANINLIIFNEVLESKLDESPFAITKDIMESINKLIDSMEASDE